MNAKVGQTVMEVAVQNEVPGIEAICGGSCACATCHVYIEPDWVARVGPPSEMEKSMLEFASEAASNSRLSCQIRVTEQLDGLVVRTPKVQG